MNQSIIEHKANMYYLEFREDYLAICRTLTKTPPKQPDQKSKASPYCEALILAIMENWTNYKRGKHEDPFIYMSYPQWINAMYGMFGRNVIAASLDELVGNSLMKREPYRMYGKDSYKYKLEADEVNRRMRTLPKRDPNAIHPDPVINKRVETNSQVNASSSKPDAVKSKRDTGLKVNEDTVKKGRNIETSQHLNKETKERETPAAPTSPAPEQLSLSPSSQKNSQEKPAQVVHPLHHFLLLDDAIAPTTLTILLTSGSYESELEDDRRMRIAEEVQWDLEARSHIVQCVCVRESEQTVIEGPPASTLERLTDEQADFWCRWCALSHCSDDALTEKLLPDIAWLAERVTTTTNLESLYRSNAAMLLELSQAKGTQYTPPHLKNLVKYYPTWASAQDAKQKQREQAGQKTVSGTGSVKNWTTARLSGQMDAPPVVYPDVEKPKKPASLTESMGIKKDLAAMLEKMRG